MDCLFNFVVRDLYYTTDDTCHLENLDHLSLAYLVLLGIKEVLLYS